MTEPSIGPREMRALKSGASDSARRWARIQDRWSLAHHHHSHAAGDARRSMGRLREAWHRDVD